MAAAAETEDLPKVYDGIGRWDGARGGGGDTEVDWAVEASPDGYDI